MVYRDLVLQTPRSGSQRAKILHPTKRIHLPVVSPITRHDTGLIDDDVEFFDSTEITCQQRIINMRGTRSQEITVKTLDMLAELAHKGSKISTASLLV